MPNMSSESVIHSGAASSPMNSSDLLAFPEPRWGTETLNSEQIPSMENNGDSKIWTEIVKREKRKLSPESVEQKLIELEKENEELRRKLNEQKRIKQPESVIMAGPSMSSDNNANSANSNSGQKFSFRAMNLLNDVCKTPTLNRLYVPGDNVQVQNKIPFQSASGSAFCPVKDARHGQKDQFFAGTTNNLLQTFANPQSIGPHVFASMLQQQHLQQLQQHNFGTNNNFQNYLLHLASLSEINSSHGTSCQKSSNDLIPLHLLTQGIDGTTLQKIRSQCQEASLEHPLLAQLLDRSNSSKNDLLMQSQFAHHSMYDDLSGHIIHPNTMSSSDARNRSQSEPKIKQMRSGPLTTQRGNSIAIERRHSRSPPLPDSSSDDRTNYENMLGIQGRPPVLFNLVSSNVIRASSKYENESHPFSFPIPYYDSQPNQHSVHLHPSMLLQQHRADTDSNDNVSMLNELRSVHRSFPQIGVIRKNETMPNDERFLLKRPSTSSEASSNDLSKNSEDNTQNSTSRSNTSALHTLLATTSQRTSPSVPESRTELCSGLSINKTDSSDQQSNSLSDDSTPSISTMKTNMECNEELPESPRSEDHSHSSGPGTSPTSTQGSGGAITVCDSEERREYMRGSSSPSNVSGDEVLTQSGHSLLQTCSESASNLSMEKDVRPKNDDQQELERTNFKYMDRRRRNNEAAKRCRANRREMFEQRSKKVQMLESENAELRQEMIKLSSELEHLKAIIASNNRLLPTI